MLSGAAPDETHSPTVSRYTDPGAVMGTAGYMSPEQVRGEPADQRSDIFALGSVLYEMVEWAACLRARHCGGDDDRDPPRGTTGGDGHVSY